MSQQKQQNESSKQNTYFTTSLTATVRHTKDKTNSLQINLHNTIKRTHPFSLYIT